MSNDSSAVNPFGPYSSSFELPPSVRRRLPPPAQEVFREAYNRCLQEFEDVEHARRMAWAAVRPGFQEKPDGIWVARTGNDAWDQSVAELLQPRRRRVI